MQLVTKTRSPLTIGEEWPLPGISVFQRRFSPLSAPLNFRGTPFSVEVPSPRGPRQPGHSSAQTAVVRQSAKAREKDRIMAGNSPSGRWETDEVSVAETASRVEGKTQGAADRLAACGEALRRK